MAAAGVVGLGEPTKAQAISVVPWSRLERRTRPGLAASHSVNPAAVRKANEAKSAAARPQEGKFPGISFTAGA
jgi:hypothetical protein